MSLQTVKAIVTFLSDVEFEKDPVMVCWHAGEPLTMPISFYEQAFEIFASGPKRVRQSIQTNGTLINDDWCHLFKDWDVTIGLSIDGPKPVHDAQRVDRSGRGTFERVTRGIEKLHEHGVYFSVITVLTSTSLEAADELWNFYKSAWIPYVGFNIDEIEGVNKRSTLTGSEHLQELRRFMSRIAELQAQDPSVEVERSDNRPGAILNFDSDGNFTTFSPELLGQTHPRYGNFRWGNVHTHSWADLASNPYFRRVREDVDQGIELCRATCGYFSVCGGGCPSNKLAEHGTFVAAETHSCRFHVQTIADVLLERLEGEISACEAK